MAHMTREFSLVLLGSGILTAGYFLWPEEDLAAKADQQAAQQVAGTTHAHRYHLFPFVYLHGMGGRSVGGGMAAKPTVARGGFGGIGRGMSGVS